MVNSDCPAAKGRQKHLGCSSWFRAERRAVSPSLGISLSHCRKRLGSGRMHVPGFHSERRAKPADPWERVW